MAEIDASDIEIKSAEDALKLFKKVVSNGRLGTEYSIKASEKNNDFFNTYNVNEKTIKEIVGSLTMNDYVKTEKSRNEAHKNDVLYFFNKKVKLSYFYDIIDKVIVNLYIKFTWPDGKDRVLILSIHPKDYEDEVN